MRALGSMQITDAQMKEALYLRYGSEAPSKADKPSPLLTAKTVANLMKIPINRVHGLISRYFRPSDLLKRQSIQPPKLNAVPMPG